MRECKGIYSAFRLLAVVAAFCVHSTSEAAWSATFLDPQGSTRSYGFGVHGGQQVGYSFMPGSGRASLWSGSSGSWVNLQPSNAVASAAYGVHGGRQVGVIVEANGKSRASMRSGLAGSWVDLHPSGNDITGSEAWGIDGAQQVGHYVKGSSARACLWQGSADS